ncbi:MAG: ABC transporter permease [Pseudonocardia sp.]|nr:ABC transporter permease [Pseudonocardia sp.]
MAAFVLRRLVLLVPQAAGAALLAFGLVLLVPGDPVALALGPRASAERVALLRAQLGLDEPWPQRFAGFLGRAFTGDLGTSIRGGVPVAQEIGLRLPATLALAGAALVLAVGTGVPAGMLAAATPRAGRAVTVLAALGLAVPVYLLAPAAVGAVGLPTGAAGLLLPAVCVAAAPAAVLARVTRAAMHAATTEPHVRTARGKGLPPWRIAVVHVLPIALGAVVTLAGLLASALLTGAVFVEVVFARPGLGRLTVDAVLARDLPVVQGVVLVVAACFLALNLLVDVVLRALDPRVAR